FAQLARDHVVVVAIGNVRRHGVEGLLVVGVVAFALAATGRQHATTCAVRATGNQHAGKDVFDVAPVFTFTFAAHATGTTSAHDGCPGGVGITLRALAFTDDHAIEDAETFIESLVQHGAAAHSATTTSCSWPGTNRASSGHGTAASATILVAVAGVGAAAT